jgi:hypothetical protein
MKNDIRFAFRMIAAHPWFSTAVIATLGLGISVNTTVFTLVNAVLFKAVPLPGGARLVIVNNHKHTNPEDRSGVAYPDFLQYREANRSFEGLEAVRGGAGTIAEAGIPPERYNMAEVSSGLFGMLRTPPSLGRDFTAEDDARAPRRWRSSATVSGRRATAAHRRSWGRRSASTGDRPRSSA